MKLFGSKHGKYEGRHTSPRRRKRRSTKSLLPLCLVLILGVCLTIGGTLAFMQQKTETVTNTFKAGDITYTLNLEANAENVQMPGELTAQSSTSLSATFTPDKAPTKTGYTFGGWYYDTDCSDAYPANQISGDSIIVKYGDSHDSNPDANKVEITLYAKWTPNTYEVAYNGNGATSGSMDNSQHTYDVEKNLTANTYTRIGYTFTGWNTAAVGGGTAYTDEASVVNLTAENDDIVTLYAQWEANSYKIKYDANTGSGTMADTDAVYDADVTLRKNTFAKTGYTFTGWDTKADGTGTDYADEATVKNLATSGDVTLYAQWKPITYTVVYDANAEEGITGSTANSTHTYDVAKNLTENSYARTGYTFIGWNTKADGSGDSYADKESVKNLTSVDGDTVTLYAQWGAKSYVLRYHANGGEGTMANQTIKYDEPTNLRKNQFTKDDHSFMGWALTPDGEVKYIDEQTVVNLLESGTLDLYAVWGQDSHTVYFDYNGGSGSPASKQFQYGKPYGQLPEYPVHPTKVISDKEVMSYLFTGWYTAPTGGTRVYPSDIANTKEDHTLYAHWEEAPTNNVIKDIVVKNNPDDDKDGVVDDVYLNLKCSSSFEKFNIPLKNLIAGQTYRITYNASNDASFGDYITGYKNSVYGSYIVATKELTGGRIDTSGTLGKDYFGMDLLATWNDRIEPDGTLDGSHAATNDSYLQGPWKNRTITFTATQSTMYWVWDFGLMEDGILDNYNITDIVLEPVEPEIEFANKQVVKGASSVAKIASQTNSTYGTTFTFDGDGGCETVYYPITGLNAGSTYTITVDHEFSGPLIHDTKNISNPTYEYGCGIMNAVPTTTGDKMTALGTWASSTFVKKTVDGKVDGVTLTFTATGDTAYWVWNMANCSDGTNTTTKVTVTNFSAKHSGGNITYYTASSKAGSAITLDLMPDEKQEITLNWDGIDDTNMDIWYPVDEQYPVAGDSYELAFEPLEGYTMAEIITVVIDDVTYEVYTNGQHEDDAIAPVYDPETNVLRIPAELLTTETTYVSVTVAAVPVEITITTEPEETTEPTETDTETEAATEEDAAITVALNLTNMTAQGDTTLRAGQDYSLVLVPDEGYQLPEIIRVEINGTLYEVYTDGLEHRTVAPGASELPPMPTFDPATGTLTIPAVLLGEITENVTITVSAVEIVATPAETESSEENQDNQTEATETSEEGTVDTSEPAPDNTVSTGDAAVLPPDNKEEDTGADTDGGDDPNSDGTGSSEETTTASEEVAE